MSKIVTFYLIALVVGSCWGAQNKKVDEEEEGQVPASFTGWIAKKLVDNQKKEEMKLVRSVVENIMTVFGQDEELGEQIMKQVDLLIEKRYQLTVDSIFEITKTWAKVKQWRRFVEKKWKKYNYELKLLEYDLSKEEISEKFQITKDDVEEVFKSYHNQKEKLDKISEKFDKKIEIEREKLVNELERRAKEEYNNEPETDDEEYEEREEL